MDIIVEPSDFQPMEVFPLKWRWTDATWNLLPQIDLAQIQPVTPAKAQELNEYSLRLLSGEELNGELFSDIVDIVDENNDSAEMVKIWLQERAVSQSTSIIVSWNSKTAVITNWGIFCEYWDDFCYPASDDVVVWPKDQSWALLYHHEEIISFGHTAP